MSVTVVRDRFVQGWPRHEQGEPGYVLDLGRALTRSYQTDAHFTAYASPNARRLTRESLDRGVCVQMNAIVLDVDCPEVHGTSEAAPEAWRAKLRERVADLDTAHPGAFYYETKGGARVVYSLAEPFEILTADDARQWSQQYAVALVYFSRRFGIGADPACHDWQRLFRLPHATREPGGKPESWPTLGDARNIGALSIKATADDVAAARATSKAFTERRITDYTPCASSGEGLLYHLLRARGDVLREHADAGSYVVRCPREADHSTGRTGDGSTLLYLPAAGEEVGAIHCLHAHCAGLRVRDWLRCFPDSEIKAAREAAGITRAA